MLKIPPDQPLNPDPAADVFLPASKVRERYCVSDMSLWRWLDDPEMNFPKPMVVHKRRYWRAFDLVAWELSQAGTWAAAKREREAAEAAKAAKAAKVA